MIRSSPPDGRRNYLSVGADPGTPLTALDPEETILGFRRHGAILFRGFTFDLDSLSAFTAQFCSRFVRNESGRRALVSADGMTQTVNLGHEAFPLHPELSRVPWRPDIAWFACARPPSRGGETLVCDGSAVAGNLDPATRKALEARRLLYREETPIGAFTEWLGIPPPDDATLRLISRDSPFIFEREGGRIFRSFSAPFFSRPLSDGEPAFANFLLFARFMLRTRDFPTFEDGSLVPDVLVKEIKKVSDRLTVAHAWQSGDLLMLDNSRFLHGRNPVIDLEERQIWTQFGYAGFLDEEDPRLAEPWRYTEDARAIFFGPEALELRGRAGHAMQHPGSIRA